MARKKGFGFSIGLDISDFEKNCKKLNKLIDQKLGANIVALSNNAVKALGAVTVALTGIGIAAYNLGSKMDTLKTAFEGTWGSAKKANEQYERLRKISENSNYGLEQLQKVDSQMKALGLSSDEAAEMVARLADVGTAKNISNLEGLSEKLLQIKVSGTVSARALKEFAEAGIEVSDLAGKDATTAINLLMERLNKFNGYLENEATDIWSQIPRAIKIVQDAIANLGNYINDNFKGYAVEAVDVLSELRDRFNSFATNEGGLYKMIGFIQELGIALSVIALPNLVKTTIALAPIAVKCLVVAATLEGILDIMRLLRGESSLLFSSFKLLFSKLASWTLDFGMMIAEWYESMFEMAEKAAVAVGNSSMTELAGLGRLGAQQARLKLKKIQQPVDDQTDDLENDVVENSQSSIIGNLGKLMGEAVENIDRIITKSASINIPATPRTRKKTSITTGDGALSKVTKTVLDNNYTWDTLKESYEQIKLKGLDCWGSIKAKLAEVYEAYVKQREELKRQETLFKNWENGIKNTFSKGFKEALETAFKASGSFFYSLGKSLRDLGKQILEQISKMLVLTFLFRAFGIKSGSISGIMTAASWSKGLMNDGKSVNDGVIQNGKIISTHPDDYIIAAKDPSRLGNSPAKIIVNVNNNSNSEISTNSYFDGTKQVIDIFIEGLSRNVSGVKDAIRAI